MSRNIANTEEVIEDWRAFYDRFSLKFDPTGIVVPDIQGGDSTRVIILAQNISCVWADEVARSMFDTHYYHCPEVLDSHDDMVHDRWPNKSYAIRIRDTESACDHVFDLTPETIRKWGIKSMTALERILLESKYFTETGRHLDHDSMACAGSRYVRDGAIIGVGWFHSTVDERRQLIVGWCGRRAQRESCFTTRIVLS